MFRTKRKFRKSFNQLKMAGIKEGIWIDAGSGYGTYTFPLAECVDQVIAIDTNKAALKSIQTQQHPRISVKHADFYQDQLHTQAVDGILFGYSLHFNPNLELAFQNAKAHIKAHGQIVILEYDHRKALPWVPYPWTLTKMQEILAKVGLTKGQIMFKNKKYYLLKIVVSGVEK